METGCLAALLFAAMSAALTDVRVGVSEDVATGDSFCTSHATLPAVALALAALGARCGALFRDPSTRLRSACSSCSSPPGGCSWPAPRSADCRASCSIGWHCAARSSSIASAAHIDIVRMGVPYQISPLAHLQVDYPAWYSACAGYWAVACACFLGLTLKLRTRNRSTS